ncbi:hypothetical protein [Kribbella sp. CA-294648]|uniref:hypothetical protein n=1 Tax=Kribbella sp. CA-294648 TaxID=3239948 RepID=UPI003D928170
MTDFASTSLPRHLIRGAIGFGALAGSIALIPLVGFLSLLLAPIGLLALRGCPTCWTIGLIQTISRGRLERTCVDGQCTLTHRTAAEAARTDPSS